MWYEYDGEFIRFSHTTKRARSSETFSTIRR